jgi:hypothetical protein
MISNTLDWTHKSLSIIDIRKLNKVYIIRVNDPNSDIQIESPIFVKNTIFEERLTSYFLKNISQISRKDILDVKWNMYITKGYFIKINDIGELEKFDHDPKKWYISYLEIDGWLSSFPTIYKNKI